MGLDGLVAANSPTDWMIVLLVPIAVTAAVWMIRLYAKKRLSILSASTDNFVDDILVDLIGSVNLAIVFVVTAFFVSKTLVLSEKLVPAIRAMTIIAAFAQVAIWGNSLISLFLSRAKEKAEPDKINSSAQRAIGFLGRLVLWTLVGALLLENLGIHLSALLAGVGIGGIALALAAQNVLGDIFCYVAIILDKPFIAGDFIVVGDLMGTVERIGIKTTRIRSLFGEQLIFSNHDLVTSRVRNYKTMAERRVVFRFGLVYETPTKVLRHIPELTRDIILSIPGVRFDRAHFLKFGDFSLDFEVVYYVLDGDYSRYMDVQQQINLALKSCFEREGIEFAYPTQLLYFRDSRIADARM
jgi:small-conductance mechanosensitive channel